MGARHYTLQLTTVGPVHIGNGKTLGKKDYFVKGSKIAIIDAKKFVGSLNSQQLEDYLKFLNDTDSSQSLQKFLGRHHIHAVANKCVAYTINEEFTPSRSGAYNYHGAEEFMKDVYGKPYVPGSSIKGMLRTAILAFVLDKNPARNIHMYDSQRAQSENRRDRMRACEDIESAIFKQEEPDPEKHPEIVNDIMRYISVSDSTPLSPDDLVFAQKYDKFSKLDDKNHKQEGNELNIYRECLKPGTCFECSIDIDERIDPYLKEFEVGLDAGLDADGLRRILRRAAEIYNERFLSHFELPDSEATDSEMAVNSDGRCQYIYESGLFEGKRCPNHAIDGTGFCNTHKDKAPDAASTLDNDISSKPITCYLGGGVGFSSKTVVNALFPGQRQRVDAIAHTLDAQFPAKKTKGDHRHWKDPELGVSPHTVKLAIVGKKKYHMGACEIEIKEQRNV